MSGPLRLLVLGGTAWLGGAVAARAVERGHEVTCLARGTSGTAPAGARLVRSDRRLPGAYDELTDSAWDVVVDVSRQPEQVRSALSALAPRTERWVFVSTISVYADHARPGADESAPLLPAWSGAGEAPPSTYREAKVACEVSCHEAVRPDRLLVARAGLIAGYGDTSDRFGYWPARLARARAGEPVLVPPLEAPVQFIDVHDLAGWLVDAASTGRTGTLDATGPPRRFGEVLAACCEVTGASPAVVDPGEAWLLRAGVAPWAGLGSLPLWVPTEGAGHNARSATAARAAGLTARPLVDTVRDALRWERELGLDRDRAAGLSPAREDALLAAVGR